MIYYRDCNGLAYRNVDELGMRLEKSTQTSEEVALLKDLYLHMLLARLMDEYACAASARGSLGFVASCRGHEAAQVGSARCIEVGQDFTLPYYRDLGVVLTIGMTPYEVFRTYRQARQQSPHAGETASPASPFVAHWGYHKHNLVTGPAPVATQIMHAAGIAFACKLRKSSAVTVAYCGAGATAEADFREGITFAAQHQLPALFLCEQDCPDSQPSTLSELPLPSGLQHARIDGSDPLAVYHATREAMQLARSGQGPTLLELCVTRPVPGEVVKNDPLHRCESLLKEAQAWDEAWAGELERRLRREIEQALEDVLGSVD
jgi:2-oxoisovalerate dehydrogenase E1 component alpha subunit